MIVETNLDAIVELLVGKRDNDRIHGVADGVIPLDGTMPPQLPCNSWFVVFQLSSVDASMVHIRRVKFSLEVKRIVDG